MALVRPARRRPHRAARRQRDGRRDALGLHLADQHRRLPVEHAGRARDRAHRPPRGDRADGAHAGHPRAPGARPRRAVLQLVRPGHRRAPDHVAGRRLAARPLPVGGRQRLAGRRAAMVENGVPELRARRMRSWPRWTSASTTTRPWASCAAGRGPSSRPGAASRRARVDDPQPLRRPELRAADGQLPRHRRRPGPARALLPPQPHLLAAVRRGRLPGDAAQRRDAHLPRRRRLRGPLRLPRHAHRPHLGRRHVRGADGPALRARGALGPGVVGRQPPALRARADRARPRRGALRLLGLLAQRQPVRRLQRLRRRRHRHAGRRLPLRQRQHVRRPRLRRLPARQARPAAVGLHQRRRHAARLVPGPALRAPRRARQPREAALALRGSTARAASTTPSTSTPPARSPAPISRSTRA